MHIKNLKVRPRKNATPSICSAQLTAMLGCMAATGDLHTTTTCADAASQLFNCMRTTSIPGKRPRSSINYHLARLGKTLK
ncbi:hypothetical protein HWV62_1530 [Athelia sp. TMB]|nr:hypothetical protein HWV62_1530 [Athelia sp. TMB]